MFECEFNSHLQFYVKVEEILYTCPPNKTKITVYMKLRKNTPIPPLHQLKQNAEFLGKFVYFTFEMGGQLFSTPISLNEASSLWVTLRQRRILQLG